MPKKVSAIGALLVGRYTPDPETGCWVWRGKPKSTGYGQIKVGGRKGKVLNAHRAVYEHLKGPVPAGLVLDHLCGRKLCVNPEHLEPVPQRTNIARAGNPAGRAIGTRTCPAGHPYDEHNTYVRPDGKGRSCLRCARERDAHREGSRRGPLPPLRCWAEGCVNPVVGQQRRRGLCDRHRAIADVFGVPNPEGAPEGPTFLPGSNDTCLYRAYDAAGEVVYIGITRNFNTRVLAHARGSAWFAQAAIWRQTWCPTRAAAEAAEREAIRTEQPTGNSYFVSAASAA